MSVYALTPLSKADIFDTWCYIADDSEDAADRVEQAIYDACALVAEAPMRGHSRPDLTTRSLRFWTLTRYPNYTVAYRPETVGIISNHECRTLPHFRLSPFCRGKEMYGAS
jgi:plasmid stabilization system protein ParE